MFSASPQVFVGTNPAAGGLRLDSKSDFELYARQCLGFRADASLTAAYARQFETIITKVYEAEYPDYRAREFFPVSDEISEGDLTFTYRMWNRVGNAALINAGNANDPPNIDINGTEVPAPVLTIGASYNFSVFNQMQASKSQFALEVAKAKAMRGAIEELTEQIFALGYAGTGVPGVLNAPGVATVTQASTGTWATQILANAAGLAQAIASDIGACKIQIATQSIGKRKATNCLLPPNLYTFLDNTMGQATYNSKSLLTIVKELTGLQIDMWPILQNASSTSGSPLNLAAVSGGNPAQKGMIMVYEKNPDVMMLMEACSLRQLAPQLSGFVYQVPAFARPAGAMSVQPLGAVVMVGL